MGDCSIVEYFAENEGYRCGYCKSENTSFSHGMWAHNLTVQDYQDLIDRGWRRSGKYCYKPTMNMTCCPQYTIRCEALKFKLSKSQKKVLKKMNKFLTYGKSTADSNDTSGEMDCYGDNTSHFPEPQHLAAKAEASENEKKNEICLEATFEDDKMIGDHENETAASLISTSPSSRLSETKPEQCIPNDSAEESKSVANNAKRSSNTLDPLRPPCRKAKEIRRERRLKKLQEAGIEEKVQDKMKNNCQAKTVEDFLNEPFQVEPKHRLELRLVPSDSGCSQFIQTYEESYVIYQKYQMVIHKDPPEKCTKKQYTRFLVNSPFQLRLVRVASEAFQATSGESYNVYKHYQMGIHKETEAHCDCKTYEEFLVDSSLKCADDSTASCKYGSFHQQYWLDDKLIAVGVLDILPYCVSSVYLYYDPDYSFLSLGTYASLREIALTRQLHENYPELQYYYMGFYIHSCPKMRYKGHYSPSFLLCPETYIFQPIEKCVSKLDVTKYSRLEEDPSKVDTDETVYQGEVMVLHRRQAMSYSMYRRLNKHAKDEVEVRQYAAFIGRKCYRRILLYRS